jgi:N-acyl-L-homoserine lactone synthetase
VAVFISKVGQREIGLRDGHENLLRQDGFSIVDIQSRPVIRDFASTKLQSPNAVSQVVNNAAASKAANSNKPSLTEAIAAVAREFIVEVADTAEIVADAQRLRYQVYCVERGNEKSDNGIEQDEFDVHSRHVLLRRRNNDEVVGCTRLVLYDPALLHDSYPMQRVCEPSPLCYLRIATTAEISRFAISKQLRGAWLAPMRLALMAGVLRISHELGLTDWCAIMTPCLLRLLQSSAIHFRPLGPLVEYHGLRQPCYANITEILARTQSDRPEAWAFVTSNGQYSGRPALATRANPVKQVARDWQTTIADAARFAFYPTFDTAYQNK